MAEPSSLPPPREGALALPAPGVRIAARDLGRTVLRAAGRLENWRVLARFCVVGSLGYGVNLTVYVLALHAGADFRVAAVYSFLVAVSHNYVLNRRWTFAALRGHFGRQGARFFTVSVTALGFNVALLTGLAFLGLGTVPAQATAIVLVTPISFLGNRFWSFGRG